MVYHSKGWSRLFTSEKKLFLNSTGTLSTLLTINSRIGSTCQLIDIYTDCSRGYNLVQTNNDDLEEMCN